MPATCSPSKPTILRRRIGKVLLHFTFCGFLSCSPPYTTFQEDVDFMGQHTEIVILQLEDLQSQIAIAPALQGRIMTSTSSGGQGRSYGWINRERFAAGDTLAHINVYGGEERFWLGPEGGQFAVFFKPGDEFSLEDWQTPRLIDLDPFKMSYHADKVAVFNRTASLTNYAGFRFELGIQRRIELMSRTEAARSLKLEPDPALKMVAYKSINVLENLGEEAWVKDSGLLSIWLLGMFPPSPTTTVVIPFQKGAEAELGPIVNDDYFGEVSRERLKVDDGVLYFRADGQYRSKIGLLPQRSTGCLGAYDAENQVLTVLKFSLPSDNTDYVNSQWKLQDNPYGGDAVNSYNDGPSEPGAKPLGPFFELETSSPALALQPGEKGAHAQETYHFEGPESALNSIAKALLGVELTETQSAL
jgi:hypothetical protein